jgi:hypothetical protein
MSLKETLELPADPILRSFLAEAFACAAQDSPVLVQSLSFMVSRADGQDPEDLIPYHKHHKSPSR